MSALRVLVADDEPGARALLVRLLQRRGVEVVAETGDGETTARDIAAHRPDLVFLDIEMPGGSGFDVISRVGPERMPPVVFVTAYDQHAIRAFEVNALDYLLKPFDEERLDQALGRAHGRRAQLDVARLGDQLKSLLAGLAAPRRLQRVVVEGDGRAVLQPVADVDWFEAEGKHVRIHVGAASHLVRERMSDLESELDPAAFVRVSRSAIVNVAAIREVQSWFGGRYGVLLRSGAQVPATDGYRDRVDALLRKRRSP
jgi:two-component system LytT family response regulator